ncbi:MAG: S24 family peptidase [Gammaproteobacteria bacterium]
MPKLDSILRALMKELKITVTQLARETGIGQPVIHRISTGETQHPKSDSLSGLAKYFNINISQLIGDEPISSDRFSGSHNPYFRWWVKVPLLTWENAIHWPDTQKAFTAEQAFVATEAPASDKSFALRMKDATMRPQFPEDTLLIVEPELAPQDKDIIAIHMAGDSQLQVKQLLHDGDDKYLKPLNGEFHIKKVEGPHKIYGVVIQALTEFHCERLRAARLAKSSGLSLSHKEKTEETIEKA